MLQSLPAHAFHLPLLAPKLWSCHFIFWWSNTIQWNSQQKIRSKHCGNPGAGLKKHMFMESATFWCKKKANKSSFRANESLRSRRVPHKGWKKWFVQFNWIGCHIQQSIWIEHLLKINLLLAGLPSSAYKAHSFRIGACSHASSMGISDDMIMKMGRWRS